MIARKPYPEARTERLCRKAANEIRSESGNGKRREACKEIVEYLCSDVELSQGDRRLIAALINGELKQGRGRKLTEEQRRTQWQQEEHARKVYYDAMAAGKPISRDAAINQTADDLKLSIGEKGEREALRHRMTKGVSLFWPPN